MVGHCCYAWAFSSCSKWGLFLIAVCGLLIEAASVAEHRLEAFGLWHLQRVDSMVVAHGL